MKEIQKILLAPIYIQFLLSAMIVKFTKISNTKNLDGDTRLANIALSCEQKKDDAPGRSGPKPAAHRLYFLWGVALPLSTVSAFIFGTLGENEYILNAPYQIKRYEIQIANNAEVV